MARETWVQSQLESYQRLKKWYLMLPCLTLSIIRCGSRVKWCSPGKGVAPSSTSQCSSYWKGNLQLDIGIMVRVFTNGSGDLGSIPGRVIPKTQKMVLDAALHNTQHYKVRIKGKVEQSEERSSTLPYTLV